MDELKHIEIKLATLTERVDRWMESTTDYRKSLCAKVEDLKNSQNAMAEKLGVIPCAVHIKQIESAEKRSDSHSYQIKAIWVCIFAGVCYFAKKAFGG